jgi:hypothetical protein
MSQSEDPSETGRGFGPLFDKVPAAPGKKPTSIEAFLSILGCRGTLRAAVFTAIYNAGPDGATRDELVDLTGQPLQSVCARVWELLNAETQVITEGPDRRRTPSNRQAYVLRVVA